MQSVKDGPCRCAASKLFPHRISKCKLNKATNFSPANSLRNLVNQADLAGLTRTNSKSPQPNRRESNAPEYLDIPQINAADGALQEPSTPVDDLILSHEEQAWINNSVQYPDDNIATDSQLPEQRLPAGYELQAPPTYSSQPSIVHTPVVLSPGAAEQLPELATDFTDSINPVAYNEACSAGSALPVATEVPVSKQDRTPIASQALDLAASPAVGRTGISAGSTVSQNTRSSLPVSPMAQLGTATPPLSEQLFVPAAEAVAPVSDAPLSSFKYEPPLWAEPENVLAASGTVVDINGAGADNGDGAVSADSGDIKDGSKGVQGGSDAPSPTPRSDPQCRCAASLAQPHRASKCRLRRSAHKVKDAAQTVGKGVTKGVTAIAQAPAPVVHVLRRRKGGAKNKNRVAQERSAIHVLWTVPREQALWTLLQLMGTTVLMNLVLVVVLLLGMGAASGVMSSQCAWWGGLCCGGD